MERISVTSKLISSVGWERGILEIEFHNGMLYRYPEVPKDLYNELVNSKSVGQFFKRYIEPFYRGTKIGQNPSVVHPLSG